MSDYTGNGFNPRRLYRDTANGVIGGVCAGIADYFGIKARSLRLVMVVSCLFLMPFVIMSYILAMLLVPRKPEGAYQTEREEAFWRGVRRDPHHTFDDVRHRFRGLDARLQRMERYVTSPRFDLDKEFKDLGK